MSPKLIGITGGIGSGKSTVAKLFELNGFKVYYADDRGKWISNYTPDVVRRIKDLLGSDSYSNGLLDRDFVAKKVFGNKNLLAQLNQIIHPAVKKDFEEWVEASSADEILFKEAALLFETRGNQELDMTILVSATENIRIERVMKRDPLRGRKEVMDIISKQLPEIEKRKLADYIIHNEGDESLIEQVNHFISHHRK